MAQRAQRLLFAALGACVILLLTLLLVVKSDAASSVQASVEGIPGSAAAGEIDDGWTKRIKLTFTNTEGITDLVDFPVLVVLNSDRIDYDDTQDAGQDIRFIDSDGTTALPHEIERWDESGDSHVWVKVPQIDGGSNSDYVWLYYGNRNVADGQDPTGVWNETYRMVYHLSEDPDADGGMILDSTANFTATNQGSTDVQGFIANAQGFDGMNQYVDLGRKLAVINEVSATTLSAWIRPTSVSINGDILALSRNNGGVKIGNSRASIVQQGANLRVYARSTNNDSDFHSIPTTSSPLSANTWHYVVAIVDYEHDAVTFYVDGEWQPASGDVDFYNPITPNTNSENAAIGSNDDGLSSFFNGLIDEARVSATARSADWIKAQYLSMSDAFIAVGGEENVGLPVLSLGVWASQEEVFNGSRLDYSLVISNVGASARQLVVTDTLPANTTFGGCNCAHVGWSTPAGLSLLGVTDCGMSFFCGLDGDQVVWRVDEMQSGQIFQLTFWVNVDADLTDGTVIVNDDYSLAADRLAPTAIGYPVTTTVREMFLSVSSNAWPNPVTVGQTLQFTITVRNDGSLLQNVTVTDRLPSNVSFLSCDGALCEIEGDEPEVTWWLASLPANSERHLSLNVAVDGVDGDIVVNALYGASVPAAGRSVMGTPVSVNVLGLQSWPFHLSLPLVLSGPLQ